MSDQRSEPGDKKLVARGTTMGGLLLYLERAEKMRHSSVITILTLMQDIQSAGSRATASEIDEKLLLLARELSKYRFIPDYSPEIGRWRLEWRVRKVGRRVSSRSETNALQFILHFATAGELDRFRKCSECSRWIYAKFSHQQFCSTKCQQKKYGKSEKWKLHRRDYMRQYRRDTM